RVHAGRRPGRHLAAGDAVGLAHPGCDPDPAVRPASRVLALSAGAGRPGALPRRRRRRLRPHGSRGRGGADRTRQRGAGMSAPLRQDAATGAERAFDPALLPARSAELRVLLGPQDDYFSAAGIAIFLSGEFTISREADRMGYRLEGPVIEHAKGYNIVSDGIPL